MLDTTNKKSTQYVETMIPADYEKSGPVIGERTLQRLGVCHAVKSDNDVHHGFLSRWECDSTPLSV